MPRPWEQQPWGDPYRVAIFERDSNKLPNRIEVARKAINLRIAALQCSSSKDTGEMDALQDALNVLTLVISRTGNALTIAPQPLSELRGLLSRLMQRKRL